MHRNGGIPWCTAKTGEAGCSRGEAGFIERIDAEVMDAGSVGRMAMEAGHVEALGVVAPLERQLAIIHRPVKIHRRGYPVASSPRRAAGWAGSASGIPEPGAGIGASERWGLEVAPLFEADGAGHTLCASSDEKDTAVALLLVVPVPGWTAIIISTADAEWRIGWPNLSGGSLGLMLIV